MKYMGSKNRYAKYLLPIILKDRTPTQWYVEPFVGGFNMIDKVSGLRLANDSHYYLIELFKAIQCGWIPPTIITQQQYKDIKQNPNEYSPYLVGFVGFGCSYSGKWFNGYAQGGFNKGNIPRNHGLESKNALIKQASKLQGIIIENKSYLDLTIPDNSIVYCDPPYQNTTKYNSIFDHNIFWDWIRTLHKLGHKVFVSEYTAPNDFICIWEKEVVSSLDGINKSKRNVERLFTLG